VIQTATRGEEVAYHKMSIIDHIFNKYDMLFCTYLDILPLNFIHFVLENGNFVLENNISLAVGTCYV